MACCATFSDKGIKLSGSGSTKIKDVVLSLCKFPKKSELRAPTSIIKLDVDGWKSSMPSLFKEKRRGAIQSSLVVAPVIVLVFVQQNQ